MHNVLINQATFRDDTIVYSDVLGLSYSLYRVIHSSVFKNTLPLPSDGKAYGPIHQHLVTRHTLQTYLAMYTLNRNCLAALIKHKKCYMRICT